MASHISITRYRTWLRKREKNEREGKVDKVKMHCAAGTCKIQTPSSIFLKLNPLMLKLCTARGRKERENIRLLGGVRQILRRHLMIRN